MPHISIPPIPEVDGIFEVSKSHSDTAEVFYVPPESSIDDDQVPAQTTKQRSLIMKINNRVRRISIYPFIIRGYPKSYTIPKYSQIECITIGDPDYSNLFINNELPTDHDEILEILDGLPPVFIKDYTNGLGLTKPYRFIVQAVESLTNCSEILISEESGAHTKVTERTLYINRQDFEKLRLELNKIEQHTKNASVSVKEATAHNILAEHLGLPTVKSRTGRHRYRKYFTAVAEGTEPLSEDAQNDVLRAVTDHAKDIAEKNPDKLTKLQCDIEAATLEILIKRYKEMLNRNLNEKQWQMLFNNRQLILNMAFGYPVIKVQDQASVGGRKLSGSGDKIVDFLLANSLTNNTAIVEIKTPNTTLVNSKPYRNSVHAPSKELSGAVNQVLDQKYELQSNITSLKVNSGIYNLETYSIHCCLIIGQIPDSKDQRRSFEIYRRNSKDVEIITFDELLTKLEDLHEFLVSNETVDVPF